MTSINDTDLFDTLSFIDTDASSDFELIDAETDDRPFLPSSTSSDAASTTSELAESPPPSPALGASQFHFPDPVSVFQDEQDSHLESSSLYTLLAPSQHSDQVPCTQPNPSTSSQHQHQPGLPTVVHPDAAYHLGDIEAAPVGSAAQEKCHATLQPQRNIRIPGPRATWVVALLAAVLLGFKADSLLGLDQKASSTLAPHTAHNAWITKFAAPAISSATAPFAPRASDLPPHTTSLIALAPRPSASSLSLLQAETRDRQPIKHARQPEDPARTPHSLALAKSPLTSKSLSVRRSQFADPTDKHPPSPESNIPLRCAPRPRAKDRRYAAFARQIAFQTPPNMPVLHPLVASSYLDNATTTTWAFWLAELHSYNRLILKPAMQAARDQAFEAARLARRYHEQQVLPAFASLRDNAVYTAHRAAEVTAQYHDEQLRPAFAYVREQATHSAQRTAEYHDKVIVPAFAQFRQQAAVAAKSTSHGLTKAAQRFSSEAADTVQSVKHTTHLNLEALGVDEYVGFMMSTFRSINENLRAQDKAT